MEKFITGIIGFALGIAMFWAYAKIANKRYGTNLDAIQAIGYKPDLSAFPPKERVKHFALRFAFKWPAIAFILAGIVSFVELGR